MTTSTNLIKATIKAVWQETPTVKGLQLRLVSLMCEWGSPGSVQLARSWWLSTCHLCIACISYGMASLTAWRMLLWH